MVLQAIHLLTRAAAPVEGADIAPLENAGIQASVTGTGAITAQVDIQVTNAKATVVAYRKGG